MKNIVFVGSHSPFGQSLAKCYARDGVKIAVVSWIELFDVDVPKGSKKEDVVKMLSGCGAKASSFSGDLSQKKVWE